MNSVVGQYIDTKIVKQLTDLIKNGQRKIHINTLSGSLKSFIASALKEKLPERNHIFIFPDKDTAAYFYNDMEVLFSQQEEDYTQKKVLFYPSCEKKPYSEDSVKNSNIILRLNTINRINNGEKLAVVTYSEALSEKITAKKQIETLSAKIVLNKELNVDNFIDILDSYKFERVDFVTQSGQYAIRGGIIDVFSFAYQKPCRIELEGDTVCSLRNFDVVSQMSVNNIDEFIIVPNLQSADTKQDNNFVSFFSYFSKDSVIWADNLFIITEKIDKYFLSAQNIYEKNDNLIKPLRAEQLYSDKQEFLSDILQYTVIETGLDFFKQGVEKIEYSSQSQPVFDKNFDIFAGQLQQLTIDGYDNCFFVNNDHQRQRIERIISEYRQRDYIIEVKYLPYSISGGFIDNEQKRSYFTDHQLFNRYHKYVLQDSSSDNEKLTLDSLITLKPGDYVTHIDYGVGKFAGLEKINNNGHIQEAIRLIYKNNDILYVSVHSLHKISRYVAKEGTEPKLNRLGGNSWQQLKQRTKKKVKDIARDLISLYARRKASKGFSFSADNYLQNELEASFIYEDTPDQYKATKDVKTDMEKPYPMDRLVCGDVGFGKTEIAVRAAFKAVCDSKQVAVLVPTTVLAFQHYQTFSQRLKSMPCRVDYINRFRTGKEKQKILQDLKEGRIDILIGTHKIVGKEVEFKDLGLLIIDEEQKFGVSMKEKIRQMKVNIDTLTLTATPIPRTLQFSLMGARDLSVINTPPANRQPVKTEICVFDEQVIRDAALFEISRGGQVFFIHNRVQNIYEVAGLIQKLLPDARICVGHGQTDGKQLEQLMMDFIDGKYDVLVSTTIVESGLDIPNVNTIIINDAQNYGLSDLHQLRGRVGRNNKKAYCYLLIPSPDILTEQASKRLSAIEEFSSIGSGFSIAMRDLDIRGAGNILGAEQSGFISEIGYDMYNKILFEAMQELKESEYSELYSDEESFDSLYQKECTVETDLEVLIPDNYITNITERLKIYKQLDSVTKEEQLQDILLQLKDRFGKIPLQTAELFDVVRLRMNARKVNINKVVLKNNKMTLSFVNSKKDGEKVFDNVFLFANQYPQKCQLSQSNDNLILSVKGVNKVSQATKILNYITDTGNI